MSISSDGTLCIPRFLLLPPLTRPSAFGMREVISNLSRPRSLNVSIHVAGRTSQVIATNGENINISWNRNGRNIAVGNKVIGQKREYNSWLIHPLAIGRPYQLYRHEDMEDC